MAHFKGNKCAEIQESIKQTLQFFKRRCGYLEAIVDSVVGHLRERLD